MRVAVVGAGIHGVSAARAIAERGHSVSLFDQFPAAHAWGSSHGRSRIVRKAYSDPFYAGIMAEAYPLWAELERASGRRLLWEVGLFYLGPESSEVLRSTAEGLRELKVPFEILGSRESAKLFPEFGLQPGEVGVFTPEAGWVDADSALAETRLLALEAGCHETLRRVKPGELDGFDRIVVCAGAWVTEWAPGAQVKVTLQTVGYVKGRHQGPVWIEDGADLMYGFPSDGFSFKVAAHRQGPEVDPTTGAREPTLQDLDLIKGLAKRRFGICDPDIVESLGCLYTNTPTEDFLFLRPSANTFVISACSGHGFKFGPWIGIVAADLVEGRRTIRDFPRFAG